MKNINKIVMGTVAVITLAVALASPVLAAGLGGRALQAGMSGSDVSLLQAALGEKGYFSARPDGVFGRETEKAVRRLEADYGLQVDGIAGPDVVIALTGRAPEASRASGGHGGKELDIVATAYAPGAHDNGKWGEKTHLGTKVRPGVVAVDPRVIPLGSRVRIQYPDGSEQYAVAEDTGGAIKGNRIDVAMATVGSAYKFGIKKVKVQILS